jgi:hypothetical protein
MQYATAVLAAIGLNISGNVLVDQEEIAIKS